MNQIPENLRRIHSLWRRKSVSLILSALVLVGRLYTGMKRAHPRRLVIPAGFAQFVILLIAMRFEAGQGISVFAAGVFLVVGLAMLPSVLPRPKYHWVQ